MIIIMIYACISSYNKNNCENNNYIVIIIIHMYTSLLWYVANGDKYKVTMSCYYYTSVVSVDRAILTGKIISGDGVLLRSSIVIVAICISPALVSIW